MIQIMEDMFEKIYAGSGLFLIVLALVNLFAEVGQLQHVYIFMCVGMFIFFDSLNYFLVDQQSLISGDISLLNGSIFVFVVGVLSAFFAEVYGAYLTGIWPGVFSMSALNMPTITLVNEIFETVLVYGILALPAYSIYRILCKVFHAETMLQNEFGITDFYKYFVHLGLILLTLPFILVFVDLGLRLAYLMFVLSLLGLLLIIEYFEFRKKGQGTIVNIAYGEMEKFGAVMGITVLTGFTVSLLTYNQGLWTAEVPFEQLQLGGTPISMFIIWTLVVWVMASGINLISTTELPNFRPDRRSTDNSSDSEDSEKDDSSARKEESEEA
jgi:hypothetical protein